MFRFGPFTFDPASGELRRGDSTTRLTPQSAQLLTMLLERRGQVVSRAELRERIWPDTTVDFDQGLSFCVRQLRIAFDEEASNPAFLETLPRRGYRLRDEPASEPPLSAPQAAPVIDEPHAPLRPTGSAHPGRRRRVALAVAVASLVVATGALVAFVTNARLRPPVRLAVVPFDIAADSIAAGDYRDRLADALVTRLTTATTGSIAVVGPSATHAFGSRTLIDTIRAHTGAAYALSGVVRTRGDAMDVFVQLIRAEDRGHIWAARWTDSSTTPTIDARIADSVATILLHPERRRRPLH